MKVTWFCHTLSVVFMLCLFTGVTMAMDSDLGQESIDWPPFMRQHDMTLDTLPRSWKEAPHFGNALIGSMLYQVDNTIKLQLFHANVQDHRDDTSRVIVSSRSNRSLRVCMR